MVRKVIQERVDIDFRNWMDEIKLERIKNGLEKEKISAGEITRMMLNTDSIVNLERELLSKRRKID